MFGLRYRHGILCQEGSGARFAQLERWRGAARCNGPEWLRSKLQDLSWKDVRESAQAAGLRVRKDGTRIWLSVGELRAALLEHLAPQRTVAPEEFGWFFSYVGLFFSFGKVSPHRRGSELVSLSC